ncbi:GD15227 [Drosophila simulans]|uniref:GD15227 n=1 Tax=Drosophila simulans TaxID=7240 RepID=B4NSJ7_DROSI|nr:GD15227 [Drosophila simulans]
MIAEYKPAENNAECPVSMKILLARGAYNTISSSTKPSLSFGIRVKALEAEVLQLTEDLASSERARRAAETQRYALTLRGAELTERISSAEKELFPLQCSNKILTSMIEEINVENTSLRTEAIKWQQPRGVQASAG